MNIGVAVAGVAVTMDMLTTTGLVTLVMIMVWHMHISIAAIFFLFFGTIEMAFFSSTMLKIPNGGWLVLSWLPPVSV